MKKKFLRVVCFLTAVCAMFAFSGCLRFSEDSERSYAEDEWNPNEDPSANQSSPSESGGGNSESTLPENPDPEKELLRTETDEIGHKIAYYTDGSSEDLGRITPIDFTPAAPTEKEGYIYFSTLEKADGLCAFYEEIVNVARNFHASNKNVTLTDEYYQIADMRFSQHGLTGDEAAGVWRTVSLEYPEFFWLGNAVLLGRTTLTVLADSVYAQASARQETQAAIEKMANECDAYLDGTTTAVERALTIHDFVAGKIEYAFEDDGYTPETEIWAHNIAGGAQYGKGVCESYAKTYEYLCELFALPCITVTGNAVQDGESFGHAWNAVNIGESWYNVDITWNDLDNTTLSREWFGTDPEKFEISHDAATPADGWSINYMFELPALDKEGLTPVRAATADDFATGKYTAETAPMYPSVEAVCGLLSEGVTYEGYLYPETSATPVGAEILWEGATLHRVPHTAGTVVIHGNYRTGLGGYYQIAELSSPEDISFAGNLVLCDIEYTAQNIDLNGNTLTASGKAVSVLASGLISGGNLTDQTTEWAEFSAVQVTTVTAKGEEFRLLSGGTVENAYLHSGVLRLSGTKDASVKNLLYATESERLYIDGAASTTKISVGNITAGTPADEETGVAAVVPAKVTVFVVYRTADDYPILSVTGKTTDADLYLLMYSDYRTPMNMGGTFIRLGTGISLSSLRVGYTWRGVTQELPKSYYEQSADGAVALK